MVETFLYNKIARGHDNIEDLTNVETLTANSIRFMPVDDLGAWSEGTAILRGDGSLQNQGFKSTTWRSVVTLDQWYYLKTNILRGNRSGPVTIQTQRHNPGVWVICNATLDIGSPPNLTMRPSRRGYGPFFWRYSGMTILEEQRMLGEIRVQDGSTAQEDITTTAVELDGWATNGEYSGVTPDYTDNSLTVGYGGKWKATFGITATKTANQKYKFNIRVNAVETGHQCQFASDALTQAYAGIPGAMLDLDADDVVTIYVETDDADAGTDLTPLDMQFTIESVAIDA